MTPTRQQLKAAACDFATDRVGGADVTAFKQAARWSQHRWAVDELGIAEFGTHRGRGSDADGGPARVANGTKLGDADASAGRNFLSDMIREVVKERLREAGDEVKSQTLDKERLRRDLLSSMPMAFNLFGEASRHDKSRVALASLFGVPAAEVSDLVFEWSPGRRSDDYTRDRTAFDVALRLGGPDEPRTVVGIETKYHEHSARESVPRDWTRYEDQTAFLVREAENSGEFVDGWQEHVLKTDLRQIWRDHLLALTMRKHPGRWTGATKYVLVYPSANASFVEAAQRYTALLKPGCDSFSAIMLEEVVDSAFAHGGPARDCFVRRYLAWMRDWPDRV